MIYVYQKFDLPRSEIRISDISKLADLPISENQHELPILVIRISNIGYIGKSK